MTRGGLTRALAVFQSELAHHWLRPSVYVLLAVGVLVSVGFAHGSVRLSSGDSTIGGQQAFVTSAFAVGRFLSVVSLLYMFFVSVAAGHSWARDHRLTALLRSTPLSPAEYVLAKFGALVATYLSIASLALASMMAFAHLGHDPQVDEFIGPFRLASYVAPFFAYLAPNIVLFAALGVFLAARGAASGEGVGLGPVMAPVLLVVVGPYFLWEWAPSWLSASADRGLMLLDPFAVRFLSRTYLDVDRGVHFYNTAALPLDLVFVANRLLWGGVAAACVAVAIRSAGEASPSRESRSATRFWRPGSSRRRTSVRSLEQDPVGVGEPRAASDTWVGRPTSQPDARSDELVRAVVEPSFVRAVCAVLMAELRALVRRPSLYVFVPLIALEIGQKVFADEGPFGTELITVSGALAADSVGWLNVMVACLMLFTTVASFERDERARAADVVGATPASNVTLVGGKVLANVVLAALILAIAALTGVAALALAGEAPVALGPLARVLFGMVLPTAFMVIGVSAGLQAVGRRSAITYGVVLGALALTGYGFFTDGLEWATNWLLLGAVHWSDFGAFEVDRLAFWASRLGAVAIGVLGARVAIEAYRRRAPDLVRARSRRTPRRVLRSTMPLVPYAVVPLVLVLVLVRGVDAGFERRNDEALRDYARAHYATWNDAALPGLRSADIDLTVLPSTRSFRARGTYRLQNSTNTAITVLPLSVGPAWSELHLEVAGRPVRAAPRASLVEIPLDPPLGPGDEVTLGFRTAGTVGRGMTENGGEVEEFILETGVSLTSFAPTFAPVIGFVDDDEAEDEEDAREPRRHPRGFHRGTNPPAIGSATPFALRTTLRGPANFTLNAVGRKVSSEVVGGTRTVRFETEHDVRFFNIVGGPDLALARGDGVEVHYLPEHEYNVAEIVATLEAARRHYGAWFAPYPGETLKLTEFTSVITRAQGFPTNISFSEGVGFLGTGELNAAFTITAHEAAHQWWANLATPARGPGVGVFTEGMSHCSTLLLAEAVKGETFRRDLARAFERRYLENRRRDAERPLIEVDGAREGDRALMYERAGLVFFRLLDVVGRERAFEAIREFVAVHERGPDYPAIADFVDALRQRAEDPARVDAYVAAWIEGTALPEERMKSAEVLRRGGRYVVSGELENVGVGEVSVPVAAIDEHGVTLVVGEVAVGEHRPARFRLEAATRPARVVVDPDVRVLMESRDAATIALRGD